MLSTRPDLPPQPLLDELITLCDAVPTFPTKEAIDIIEEDLGMGAGTYASLSLCVSVYVSLPTTMSLSSH